MAGVFVSPAYSDQTFLIFEFCACWSLSSLTVAGVGGGCSARGAVGQLWPNSWLIAWARPVVLGRACGRNGTNGKPSTSGFRQTLTRPLLEPQTSMPDIQTVIHCQRQPFNGQPNLDAALALRRGRAQHLLAR